MVFSLLIGLGFWTLMALTPLIHIPLHLLKLMGRNEEAWFYLTKVAKLYTWIIFKGTGTTVIVHGREKLPKTHHICVISNHQAYSDIITIMSIMPRIAGYIAKKELQKVPFLNAWMTEVGCYFMDRNNIRDGLNGILFGVKRIKAGYPMVIFPEGTRSKGKAVAEFKKGSIKLATKSKAVIVPISINGTYHLLEETGRILKTTIEVMIHDPIDTQNISASEEDALSDRLWETISGGVKKLQGQ